MKALWFTALVLLALGATSSPRAEGVPGANDPALRAAVEAWLTEEDPRPSLWAIGEIAADGNPAARLLARSLHRRVIFDFPDMSQEQRRALFPPDRSSPSRGFILYPVDRDDAPTVSQQSGGMHFSKTPDEWIGRAQKILEAGRRELFLTQVRVALSYPHLNIEAARFAERFLTDADPIRLDLWMFRDLERQRLDWLNKSDPEEADARRARWGEPPWSETQMAAFQTALKNGRWSAIWVAGYMSRSGSEVPFDATTARQYARWSALSGLAHSARLDGHPPPTDAELEHLGDVLIHDAGQSPYLRPLRNACARHCPAARSLCMATSVLAYGSSHVQVPTYLEPIVSAAAYYDSRHAVLELLSIAGGRARTLGPGPEWLPVPQCFRDAAQREIERVDPMEGG